MKANLKIEHQDGSEELVDYEFSQDEIQLMQTFCNDAWALRTSAIYGEKAANRFTINYNQEIGVTFVGDPIDDEAWDAGMHRMRPLLLSDEPSSFYNIASLIGKRVASKALHEKLKYLRKKFRGELMPAMLSLSSDGVERSMEDVFNMWINAFEHHRDQDKQAYFRGFEGLISDHQMRHFINAHAVEKLRAIMELFKLALDLCGEDVKPQGLLDLERSRRSRSVDDSRVCHG